MHLADIYYLYVSAATVLGIKMNRDTINNSRFSSQMHAMWEAIRLPLSLNLQEKSRPCKAQMNTQYLQKLILKAQ